MVRKAALSACPGPELHEQAFLNGISYELRCCRDLLDRFLENSYKYTTSLLPSDRAKGFWENQPNVTTRAQKEYRREKLEREWRKISWVVFQREDVDVTRDSERGDPTWHEQKYPSHISQAQTNPTKKAAFCRLRYLRGIQVRLPLLLQK
ncbi:hypothetical protein BJX70DRAFT_396695 [Aspergillus crustosus]